MSPFKIEKITIIDNLQSQKKRFIVYTNIKQSTPNTNPSWIEEGVPHPTAPVTLNTAFVKADFELANEYLYSNNNKKNMCDRIAVICYEVTGVLSRSQWIDMVREFVYKSDVNNSFTGFDNINPHEYSNTTDTYVSDKADEYVACGYLVSLELVQSYKKDAEALEVLSKMLPGANAMIFPPCACKNTTKVPVRAAVIHLNDVHLWKREAIADWLDEVHESGEVDLEFKVN